MKEVTLEEHILIDTLSPKAALPKGPPAWNTCSVWFLTEVLQTLERS